MHDLKPREWLLTNGNGSFASGIVIEARTRTYHGWLIAAQELPSQRTLLLSHQEAASSVVVGTNFWGNGTVEPIGYKLLRSFEVKPIPTWVWGQHNLQLSQ